MEFFSKKKFASILDEPRETLDPEIFDLESEEQAPKIRSDVREEILSKLYELGVDPSDYKAVYFIGSSASFQYDKSSDIDITVITDNVDEGINKDISDSLYIGCPFSFCLFV